MHQNYSKKLRHLRTTIRTLNCTGIEMIWMCHQLEWIMCASDIALSLLLWQFVPGLCCVTVVTSRWWLFRLRCYRVGPVAVICALAIGCGDLRRIICGRCIVRPGIWRCISGVRLCNIRGILYQSIGKFNRRSALNEFMISYLGY